MSAPVTLKAPLTRLVERVTYTYRRKPRALIVTLDPAGLVTFRLHGCRQKHWSVPLRDVAIHGVREMVRALAVERKKKQAKREAKTASKA